MSNFMYILLSFALVAPIGLPLATSTGYFRDEQASKLSCENFNTTEMCKLCKKKIGKRELPERYCYKDGKKFELIEPFDSSNQDNYQQGISIYPPNNSFCYIDITYSHFQDSTQEHQDRLYINKTAKYKSCSKLGNWIITKFCDFHGSCRNNEKHDYMLHYERGMK